MNILRVFYIFVILAGIITINNNISHLVNPTVFVALLGIISAVLFFKKIYKFYYLSIIWIIVQIPYYKSGGFVFDLAQLVNSHFSLNFGDTSIGINTHILLLLLLNHLILSGYLYRKVYFKAYTENSKLKMDDEYSFIPTDIKFKKLIGKSEIQIESEMYDKIEFEPIKDERIKKAGILILSENENEKINATVEYKLTAKE